MPKKQPKKTPKKTDAPETPARRTLYVRKSRPARGWVAIGYEEAGEVYLYE